MTRRGTAPRSDRRVGTNEPHGGLWRPAGSRLRAAGELLAETGVEANIRTGDFFCSEPTGSYDVVIGNPPYVDFTGEARTRSVQTCADVRILDA